MSGVRRQAARAVVLDGLDRVLLIRARDPFAPAKGEWWELPGGGMEPGEESARAAGREVIEETGLAGVEIGPCVWRHDARFTFAGLRFEQLEHIHVARWEGPAGAAPYAPGGLEALEAMAFSGMAWWTVPELADMQADGGKIIPPWLPDRLARYLADGFAGEAEHLGELGPVF